MCARGLPALKANTRIARAHNAMQSTPPLIREVEAPGHGEERVNERAIAQWTR